MSISKIKFPLPIWKYLVLFQSRGQFFSWVLIVLGTSVVVQMLMQLIGVRLIPIEIVSLGVAIGSLVSVVMVFRAEIEIQPASPNTAMMLKEVLETFKYVPSHSSNAGEVYTQDLPRMLRWDEGNVTLEKNEKGFILNGGVTILMLIRKELTSPRKK